MFEDARGRERQARIGEECDARCDRAGRARVLDVRAGAESRHAQRHNGGPRDGGWA